MHHAVSEAALIEQFELEPYLGSEGGFAAADHDRGQVEVALVCE